MAAPNKNYVTRVMILATILVLSSLAIAAKLIYLQIFKAEEYHAMAMSQWTMDKKVSSKRGLIFDRNGKKLAVNLSLFSVWCRPEEVEKKEESAKVLSELLGMSYEEIMSIFDSGKKNRLVKRWVDEETKLKLDEKKIAGIDIADDIKRYYPYGTIAGQIIGFTNIDNNGIDGMELYLNDELNGVPGRVIVTKDAHSSELPYGIGKNFSAQDGNSIVLTIDEKIQEIAEIEAIKALQKTNAKKVTVVAMDPSNGQILAMTTKPDYDPNRRNELLYDFEEPWQFMNLQGMDKYNGLPAEEKSNILNSRFRNSAVIDLYEPGSTFKIVTAASAIEENRVGNPFTNVKYFCDGRVTQLPGNLRCWYYPNSHGAETLAQGMQNSCNEVSVAVALDLGQETLLKYIKAFGFGSKTQIELSGEVSGFLPADPSKVKPIELATMSYGQGLVSVTPIQLITAYAAIVNGGERLQPTVIKEIVNAKGDVDKKSKKEVKAKVISKETSDIMRKILRSVVTDGVGKKANLPGYRIGGKTGTASKVINGAYQKGIYISSFIGVAPADNPKILVLTVVDEPRNGTFGSEVALPTTREVIRAAMDYMDVAKVYTEEEKKIMAKEITVPDLTGKTLKNAETLLEELGLRITFDYEDFNYSSIISEQFPSKGTIVHPYTEVKVKVYSEQKTKQ